MVRRVGEGAVGELVEQLGDTAVLRDDHIEQVILVIVEPHRQSSAEVRLAQTQRHGQVDQPLILVDEELAEITGAGADHQVLVAVVVVVRPGRAVGVGVRAVLPIQGLGPDVDKGARCPCSGTDWAWCGDCW